MTQDATSSRCPWCREGCRRWGLETCPLRPRQIPREPSKEPLFMSNPAIQQRCANNHPMDRGADWCGACGEPPTKQERAQDSSGRPITVGNTVTWRGEVYTIKSFGEPVGRFGTRTIAFEEPLHITDEVPDEIGVDLVESPQ